MAELGEAEQTFPAVVELELTNRCNLACVMCPRTELQRPATDMDAALLEKLLDEALQHPDREFRLHGLGEPLLAPSLRRVVERIKDHPGGHRISLITNGVALTRTRARLLIELGVDVVRVSVGAAGPASYRAVHGEGGYERVLRNVVDLIEERDRLGADMIVGVQTVRLEQTAGEIDAFIEHWSGLPVRIEVWNDFNAGRADDGLGLPPCPDPFSHILVRADGIIDLCCMDVNRAHPLGDATLRSIAQVFNGEPLVSLRRAHREDRLPICLICPYRDESHIVAIREVAEG